MKKRAENVTVKTRYIPEPERMIRTIKDGVRSLKSGVRHFKKFPRRLIIEMVAAVLLFYNLSIPVDPVSKTIPPYTILTGKVLDVKRDMKHRFGEYVEVTANVPKEKSNNTDVLRTFPGLATRPLCNDQGSHFYYSLITGKVIKSTHATP